MFITKECDYGIRIIRALADGTKKTANIISNEEKIPYTITSKIIKKLMNAAYVQSIRGSNGGYQLSRPLDTITLVDIITAVDANRCINECLRNSSVCDFKSHPDRPCTVHHELAQAQDIMVSALRSKTMDTVIYGKFLSAVPNAPFGDTVI